MSNICFVVHRYAPFPGGSEYYVQQMAEECVRRGHDVTVLAGEHKGHLNGVRVTSEASCLMHKDLVVVHGGDVNVQNFVLQHARAIDSPILYMLIKPSNSKVCIEALNDVKYIGCSTFEDWEHVKNYYVEDKACKVIHGISPADCMGVAGKFKDKYNIPKEKLMFLSCGGYWPNKRMIELAEIFEKAQIPNAILVTTGYDNRYQIMPRQSKIVFPLMVDDPQDVKNAIRDADCYIMNSDSEGFGLVILEAMLNETPWIARNIAGAKLLSNFGTVYENESQLVDVLRNWKRDNAVIKRAYTHILKEHLIQNTVDDILKLL